MRDEAGVAVNAMPSLWVRVTRSCDILSAGVVQNAARGFHEPKRRDIIKGKHKEGSYARVT